ELERRMGAALHGGAPRADVRAYRDHAQVPVEEDDVDREAHKGGLDVRRRADQEALAAREVATAQEALHPGERRARDRAPLAHDLPVARQPADPSDLTHSRDARLPSCDHCRRMSRSSLCTLASSLRRREDGTTTAEYALVLVLAAVGAVAAYAAFGAHLGDYWNALTSAV